MPRPAKPDLDDPLRQQALRLARRWRCRAEVIEVQRARQKKAKAAAIELVAVAEAHRLRARAETYRACADELEAATLEADARTTGEP